MNDATEYQRRAQANRPTDPEMIAAEVIRLSDQGLLPRDIAAALQLSVSEVAKILVRRSLARAGAPGRGIVK